MKKMLSLVLAALLVLSMVPMASAEEITDFVDYETTAREMESFCYHYSQQAVDLNVLSNLYDHLLTNNAKGELVGCAAKEWSSPDGGQTWFFTLNDGMTWVDYQGNVKADVVAQDWATGLEWILNYGKNASNNTTMPIEMIKGAGEYYEYTKELGVDASKALAPDNEKFKELVGIEIPDDKTVVYHCIDKLSYFPSLASYNCLAPLSAAMLEELGVDGYFGASYDVLWYNGPYIMTDYIYQNEKVLTKNPNYYADATTKRFDTVTIKMVDSTDTAYQWFLAGDIDRVSLTQANLSTIYNNESNEFHQNLVELRPTKYSYQMHLCYERLNEDGTPDVNWNTAAANENFRLALYYGLDVTPYLARTNFINPLACQNFCYTANAVAVNSQGVDYTQLVRDELGLQYSNDSFARVDADKAAAYKAAAMDELAAAGVELPVKMVYYIKGDSQTAKDTADTLAQIISDCLGDDMVQLEVRTYVTSLNTEVRNPQLASIFINGWGADYADPVNFLGQETYGEDGAFYAKNYSKINNVTDENLLAIYKEFTQMVSDAKAITDDMDARYAAFAKAEAYMIQHALVIPWNYEVSWELTCVNPYTKIYTAYGNQSERYVNLETNSEIYTTEEIDAYKAGN